MEKAKHIFVAIGLILLSASAFFLLNTASLLNESKEAVGKVVEIERHSVGSGPVHFSPVIRFTTENGTLVEFSSAYSSTNLEYGVGDEIEVLYQNTSPMKVRLKHFFALWGAAMILGIIGGLFILVRFLFPW